MKWGVLQYVRSAAMTAFIPLLTFLISLFALIGIVVFRLSPRRIQALPRLWGRIICRGVGVSVRILGLEKIVAGRPYIFAANHQSQFDIFALQGYFPYDFRWMAKMELFRVPVFGQAMRLAGYIPVNRASGREALQSLGEAAARIAAGTSVVIFPEGTRSPDGHLLPFKSGGMALAIKAGVPVVPVAISGTRAVLPKGRLLAAAGRVVIRLGDPIETGAYTMKQKGELAARLQEQVAALLAERP
ncbi:MAG: lysophospholipid acyltransferase family protein [Thermodesulfobacteriota bacterium]